MSRKPFASVSLDLDNLWSYMKTHGDAGWESYPSYLDIVVPRVLDFLAARRLRITWFIVGVDAADPRHHRVLRSIVEAGHEVGNHSYHHEPWLHLYTPEAIEEEFAKTESAIEAATGVRPTGFRGPGFSFSPAVLNILAKRGYQYDASTFPTFLGPLARLYYFFSAKNLSPQEHRQRSKLFGEFSEGLRPLRPYVWNLENRELLEIPVTTLPVLKAPIHASYILYLGCYSRFVAMTYFRNAMRLCRWTNHEPSLLLHPLDFMGADDTEQLRFFPAMNRPWKEKTEMMGRILDALTDRFEALPMGEHAQRIRERGRLKRKRTE